MPTRVSRIQREDEIMNDMQTLEQVICPATTARITFRIVLCIFLLALGLITLRLAIYGLGRAEDVTTNATRDEVWFRRTEADIEAFSSQIEETSNALNRKKLEMETRWISRSDDRQEFDALNHRLMELVTSKANLVKEYQIALAATVCGVPQVEKK